MQASELIHRGLVLLTALALGCTSAAQHQQNLGSSKEQDEGYIVKNAVLDLGLLTATKEMDVEDKAQVLLMKLLRKNKATWPKNAIVEATANVSEFGSETRVRLNFQLKTYDNRGAVRQIKQIEDAKFYQDFFAKVDKGIFIQKENL